MPHLSPMHWVFCPMIFWALMFMFASNLWWHQSPIFPAELISPKTKTSQPWSWAPTLSN